MQYLLNALPAGALFGCWFNGRPALDTEPEPVTRHIRLALQSGLMQSAVGHAGTAAALSALFGINVPCDRRTIMPIPGDSLFVAAIRGPRLEEGRVLSEAEVRERGFDFLIVDIVG